MNYRYNFNEEKSNNKKRIIFVIVFFIFMIMFVAFFFRNSSNVIVNKLSTIISKPITFLYDICTGTTSGVNNLFKDSESILAENEALKQENEELKLQALESKRILDENVSLKNMLNISKEYQHFDIKLGNVIFREHDNWTQTFTINLGSKDGVKLKQAVVHEKGLVGYISAVNEDSSVVTTILDPTSSVSVTVSTINEPAMLKGDLELKSENKLKLTYIPLDTEIAVSDVLYTSGLGSMYPSSIPVGKIIEVVNKKNDIGRYAIVEPNVDIRRVSEVGVIIN
ncbi:MAG: rod shape-determining protein MreC [Clostridia bacterium]|nr:rod shape-determining protein MreC [Clostridia bacterium]